MTKIKYTSRHSDIRDKQPARAHRRIAENYNNIIDDVSDGLYRANPDGHFTYVNKIITEQSGISPEQFYSSHFLDILDPQDHDLAKKNFRRVMEGENRVPYELRYKDTCGQTKIIEVIPDWRKS
jgi:PAS domain S-box-containing protein